jgi:proteasome activator-like protein
LRNDRSAAGNGARRGAVRPGGAGRRAPGRRHRPRRPAPRLRAGVRHRDGAGLEASRNRLKEIHEASIHELEAGLAPELVEELDRLTLPFSEDQTPSESELRIAQAQLVGWLEGLFHGIQTAIYAQQMAARAQFEQMRRGLPAGQGGQPPLPGDGEQPHRPGDSGGMYL